MEINPRDNLLLLEAADQELRNLRIQLHEALERKKAALKSYTDASNKLTALNSLRFNCEQFLREFTTADLSQIGMMSVMKDKAQRILKTHFNG